MKYCETKEDFLKYAEHLYESHVEKKMGFMPSVIDMAKLMEMKFPFEVISDAEKDYRRGFDHGFCYAAELMMELFRMGYSRQSEISNILWHFEERTLKRWRYDAYLDVENGIRNKFDEGHPKLSIKPWNEIREAVFQRDGYICKHCGTNDELHCDHIRPVACGGLPTMDNLQTLCAWCNSKKGPAY